MDTSKYSTINQIIDIGINLLHHSFEADREEIVRVAEADNISPLIITGTNVKSSMEASNYAAKFPNKLYSTAGVHPHDSKGCNSSTLQKLKSLAKNPQVVAIGECGLDYDRDFSPRDIQCKWFEEQINLACELNMPLFLHERSAFEDFISIMKSHEKFINRAVVHCFTGNEKELNTYISMGYYIGITGWICDERRGKHLKNLVKIIPIDKLMIETDAPFLTPRDLKSKPENNRNEPIYLRHILNTIAKCRNMDTDELAYKTTHTAKMFFGV